MANYYEAQLREEKETNNRKRQAADQGLKCEEEKDKYFKDLEKSKLQSEQLNCVGMMKFIFGVNSNEYVSTYNTYFTKYRTESD